MSNSNADEFLWVVGHRGSPELEIENTIESFQRALDEGANALELDVCVSADGQLPLWHDFDPTELHARLRRAGLEPIVRYRPRAASDAKYRRPVDQLELSELRRHFGYAEKNFGARAVDAHIPTLDEFFEWAVTQPRLGLVFLDVKVPPHREQSLQRLLDRVHVLLARWTPNFKIVFESASVQVSRFLSNALPLHGHTLDIEPPPGIVLTTSRYSAVEAAITHRLTHAASQRPRSVTLFPFRTHRAIVEADLQRMRRHNQTAPAVPLQGLCAFTINDESELHTLISLGVWAVQSDRPTLATRVARRCGRG